MSALVTPPLATATVGVAVGPLTLIPVPARTCVTPLLPPGNVCPGAKVMMPFEATDSPVSTNAAVPGAKASDRRPLGVPVLLPTGSTVQRNRCAIADDVV